MKAAVMTLGCRANQADTMALSALLKEAGYQMVPWREVADLYLINTCTVTASSDQQSRQAIRQAARRNPSAIIVATGCYAQVDPSAIARIGGVDLVLGNQEKLELKGYLPILTKGNSPRIAVGEISRTGTFPGLRTPGDTPRTRPLLKIQDGCHGACSYCIVPFARGLERSLPPLEVRRHFAELIGKGFREIVLTGIRLGAYGRDLEETITLPGLLKGLFSLPGRWRIRLSSLEPQDTSPDLISIWKGSPPLCHHLHLPLQSGDDEILALMGRPASAAAYRRLLEDLIRNIPDLGLGADIMVGFPGETKEHFLRTYRFLEEAPLSYIHVFPFSPRPGTTAASFPQTSSAQEKRERTRRLRSLSKEKSLLFRSAFIGKPIEAIVLRNADPQGNRYWALSDNYVPILIPDARKELVGQLVRVEIEGMSEGVLWGRWKK